MSDNTSITRVTTQPTSAVAPADARVVESALLFAVIIIIVPIFFSRETTNIRL